MNRLEFIKACTIAITGILIMPFSIFAGEQWRTVERYSKNGWQKINFKDIKKDMVVRMFNPDGSPVVMFYKKSKPIYKARVSKDVYKHKDKILAFEIHKTEV